MKENTPKRKLENARRFAERFLSKFYSGQWVIVIGSTWYGTYDSEDFAKSRIGLKDSLDMTVEGVVVQVP